MRIPRDEVRAALHQFVDHGSGLVIGAPGIGKTYLLRQLVEERHPALYLPIDRLHVTSDAELRQQLGLASEVEDYLEEYGDESDPRPVVFDSFDSARFAPVSSYFERLIDRAIQRHSRGWRVLVSVRTYDASKSPRLLRLFPARSDEMSADYTSPRIQARHIRIPELSDSEVWDVLEQFGLSGITDRGSAELKEMLRIPFNLWLLEQLGDAASDLEIGGLRAPEELIQAFWNARVGTGVGVAHEVLLAKFVENLVTNRRLSLRLGQVQEYGDPEVLNELFSLEILDRPDTASLTFRHNILFDFAVSALLLGTDVSAPASFLASDPGLAVFLRPSFEIHFRRLFCSNTDAFWGTVWDVLGHENAATNLIGRTVPFASLTDLTRAPSDLSPLVERAHDHDHTDGAEAARHMMDAIAAREPSADWLEFAHALSRAPRREFASPLARYIADIEDGLAVDASDRERRLVGGSAVNLLRWCLEERRSADPSERRFLDAVGARWALPAVARSLNSVAGESVDLLAAALQLIEEPNFPMDYPLKLADAVVDIASVAPSLAVDIYVRCFSHVETSDVQTEFGTPLVPLISTRRQNYDMVRYQLGQQSADLLAASPDAGIAAVVSVANQYAWRDAHRQGTHEPDVTFDFLGVEAGFFEDYSRYHADYREQEPEFVATQSLFNMIGDPAISVDDTVQRLRQFAEHAQAAMLWGRLLELGARQPERFSSLLLDLAVARPIQEHGDSARDLSSFLAAVIPHLDESQRLGVELSILELPRGEAADEEERLSYIRDALLASFPTELLQTAESARCLEQRGTPAELPDEHISAFARIPFGQDDFLAREGVDFNLPGNASIRELMRPIRDVVEADPQPHADLTELAGSVRRLRTTLREDGAVHELLEADAVALQGRWACKVVREPELDADSGALAASVLMDCAAHNAPVYRPDVHDRYDSPSWSSSPRVEAAQGLPRLASHNLYDSATGDAFEQLASDPVPSVRMLVGMNVCRVLERDPDRYWRILLERSAKEENEVVLRALGQSFRYGLFLDEDRRQEFLENLCSRLLPARERSEAVGDLLAFLVALTVAHDDKFARRQIEALYEDVRTHARAFPQLVWQFLTYVTPQRLAEPEKARSAERATQLLVDTLRGVTRTLVAEVESGTPDQTVVEPLSETMDNVLRRLDYSTSDADDATHQVRAAFETLLRPALDVILELPAQPGWLHPQTTHHAIQLLRWLLPANPQAVIAWADEFTSRTGSGYSLDSIAAREIVALVEDVLVGQRPALHDEKTADHLVRVLERFTRAGWPEALDLVWRLDEVYR